MRALKTYLAAALVACVLTAGVVRADTPAPVPAAAGAAQSAMVYVEVQKADVQGLLSMAATMPVMRLISSTLHISAMQTRFGLVEQLLHLAPGSFDEAAPHLTKIAFVDWQEQVMAILSFDEAGWAEKLVQGGEKGAGGTVTLSDSISAVVRGNDLAVGAEDACGAVASGAYDAFLKSADLQAARASAGDAAIWGYVNLPAVTKSLTADDESEAAQVQNVMAMVGLNTVPYGVLTVQSKDAAGAATLSLKLAENQGGVLGMLPQGAPPMPALVPAGASASLVLDWGDAGAFLAGLKKLRLSVDDFQAPTVGDQLDGMLQMWGLSLEKLGAQLGSGAAVYLPAPGPDGMLSRGDATIVLHLKDAAGFRTTLDTVMKGMHQEMAPATFGGTEMLQMMMPPCYMKFMDDRLVIGASPAAVNRYLKAQFPPAAAPAAGEPAGALVLRLDTGLLTTSYPKPESGTKVYLALLRDGQVVKLRAGYTDLQPQSLSRAYLTAYFGVMAAMIMPALERARGEAQRANGANNLHQVGLAIHMYRAEHDDQYPPDLESLVSDSFLDDPKIFVDPADKAPQVRGAKGYRYSYEYAGPLPAKTPPNFIVAYSRKGINPSGRNVVYVDNSVEFVTEQALHQPGGAQGSSLKEQYDWVMANSGTTLTDEQKAAFRKFYEVDAAAATAAGGAPLAASAGATPSQAALPAQADARVTRARTDIATLGLALDTLEVDMGRYPTAAEGLTALVTQPAGMKDWKGPYIKGPVPLDPWGHPYVYKSPGDHNKDGYDLHSFGPDGQDGGGDDVDNWSGK